MKTLLIATLGIFLLCVSGLGNKAEAAEEYPVKPITFIIPLEAGSGGDVLFRPALQKLSRILGQPVIVVNKPGGGSAIGYRELYNSKPDGYTIGSGHTTLFLNKLQGISDLTYRDFTVMGTRYNQSYTVVGSLKTKRPFKTIQEVLAFAKSHPEEVSIASGGKGQTMWIASMAFQFKTGVKFNIIPQPGVGAYVVAQVAGGNTDIGITDYASAKALVEAGNLRLLAVFGPNRIRGQNAPTLAEIGYDVKIYGPSWWIGPPKCLNLLLIS